VSLSEVFQNALKHNTVAVDRPLHIQVRVEDEMLVVENNIRAGPTSVRSTRIGLTNMRERFRIATGRVMVWGAEEDRFIVRLPLVSSSSWDQRDAEPPATD
jgi:glucose-6-phosphate-specific signal transduction histidine kinase